MKAFCHWTPKYIVNRLNEVLYHKRYPDHPWLTKSANCILTSYLKKSDIALEFGSGRSTLWFAARIGFLTSVEHDPLWYKRNSLNLKKRNLSNVNCILIEKNDQYNDGWESKYVQVAESFSNESLDLVIVDGIYRCACAMTAIDKLRTGGMLIIDNVNWFLPSKSISPNSRSFSQGPLTPEWGDFLNKVKEWRCIWTTSGVTDTALFLKPCS